MRLRALLLLLMVPAATACNVVQQIGGGGAQACTEIGCESQISVTLDDFELDGGEGVVETRMCFDDRCDEQRTRFTADGASFGGQRSKVEVFVVNEELNATLRLPHGDYDDTTEHTVSLEVTVNGGKPVTLERTVTLQRSQPNGPNCEPVCWQATIRA